MADMENIVDNNVDMINDADRKLIIQWLAVCYAEIKKWGHRIFKILILGLIIGIFSLKYDTKC